jgi:hypothetical protein
MGAPLLPYAGFRPTGLGHGRATTLAQSLHITAGAHGLLCDKDM